MEENRETDPLGPDTERELESAYLEDADEAARLNEEWKRVDAPFPQ